MADRLQNEMGLIARVRVEGRFWSARVSSLAAKPGAKLDAVTLQIYFDPQFRKAQLLFGDAE